MRALLVLLLFATSACAGLPAPGEPGAPKDSRYCGEPARDAQGRIKRSDRVLREFVKVWTCPANGLPVYGAHCPGWAIDHVLPLARGGCDLGHNLTWMRNEIKRCAGQFCKDRWERDVYDPARPGERH